MTQPVNTMRLSADAYAAFEATLLRVLPTFVDNTVERNAKFPKNKAGKDSIKLAGYSVFPGNNVTVYFNGKVVLNGDLASKDWGALMTETLKLAKKSRAK